MTLTQVGIGFDGASCVDFHDLNIVARALCDVRESTAANATETVNSDSHRHVELLLRAFPIHCQRDRAFFLCEKEKS